MCLCSMFSCVAVVLNGLYKCVFYFLFVCVCVFYSTCVCSRTRKEFYIYIAYHIIINTCIIEL